MSRQRSLVSFLLAISVGLGAAVALGESIEEPAPPLPYDPACLWGRLANGKGTVVRCLTEKEANIISAVTAALPGSSTAPAGDSGTLDDNGRRGSGRLGPGSPKTRDEGYPGDRRTRDGRQGRARHRQARRAEGSLREVRRGQRRLKGAAGEVHVRFLVRSKGVAEGVSVQKRSEHQRRSRAVHRRGRRSPSRRRSRRTARRRNAGHQALRALSAIAAR